MKQITMGILNKRPPSISIMPPLSGNYDRPVTAFVAKTSMRREYNAIIWHTGSPQITPRSKSSVTICATTPSFIRSWVPFFLPRFSYLSTLRRRMIRPALLNADSGTGQMGASEYAGAFLDFFGFLLTARELLDLPGLLTASELLDLPRLDVRGHDSPGAGVE
jgi:hypothetical protein